MLIVDQLSELETLAAELSNAIDRMQTTDIEARQYISPTMTHHQIMQYRRQYQHHYLNPCNPDIQVALCSP